MAQNPGYSTMFNGCISLKTVGSIEAIALSDSCYVNMFKDCISLE